MGPRTAADELVRVAEVIARLRRALRRGVRLAVPQERVSVAQAEVLQLLADHPGIRAGELAESLRLAPTTVSTLIGQLLGRRLVRRIADPSDRRAWRLALTPGGARLLVSWQQANARILEEALAGLPAGDRRAIAQALPALERLTERLLGSG